MNRTVDTSGFGAEVLAACWAAQPRGARIFSPALEVLWDNAPDRLERYPIYRNEAGEAVAIPPEGTQRHGWPVARMLAEGEACLRDYWVQAQPPDPAQCFRVKAWPLSADGTRGLLVVEEIERIDKGPCHDKLLKQMDSQLTELMSHVTDFLSNQRDSSLLQLRLANPNLQPCRQIKQCKRRGCPGYNHQLNPRCWEIPNTQCPEGVQTRNLIEKFRHCDHCEVYLMACPDPLTRVGENFNRLLTFLQMKYQETLEANRHRQQMEKMAAIGELTMGIAHEIKNPLSIIMSRLDCLDLELDSLSQDELARDLDVLKGHAARMRRFLDDLLTLSRPAPTRAQRVQLNQVIAETLPLVRKTLEKSGIGVTTRLARQAPQVLADPVQVQQVLLNLILNARDAMPRGGAIQITSRYQKNDPSWVKVAVKDDGRGMSQEELYHIFSPFFSTKTDTGGTGLGLALCRRMMSQQGGTISASSRPGKGSTFTLSFKYE